jgi:hypothetical protein
MFHNSRILKFLAPLSALHCARQVSSAMALRFLAEQSKHHHGLDWTGQLLSSCRVDGTCIAGTFEYLLAARDMVGDADLQAYVQCFAHHNGPEPELSGQFLVGKMLFHAFVRLASNANLRLKLPSS